MPGVYWRPALPAGDYWAWTSTHRRWRLPRETLAPYGERVTLTQVSYDHMLDAMQEIGWQTVDGIVLDLGVSSMQLDTAARGFSFQSEAPLDMRFNPDGGMTAAELVNSAEETELADMLYRFGEERQARRIARMIVAGRPIRTTTQLAELVRHAYRDRQHVHPATRTFQALRIVVNDELAHLERALPRALQALKPGGRLAVISFHSLEDRIVKRFFREQSQEQVNPPYMQQFEVERPARLREVSRKPIVASEAEVMPQSAGAQRATAGGREDPNQRVDMNLPQASRHVLEQFFHAHALAPWRAQRQWIGVVLLAVIGLGMTAALYLDVTSEAAITGRQIQRLRINIVETELVNADLQSQLAESTSTESMEQRARALGFEPVDQGDLEYMPVPGYVAPEPVILVRAGAMRPAAASMAPEYSESLFDWIGRALTSPTGSGWAEQ